MVTRVQISEFLNSTETGRKPCDDLASLRLQTRCCLSTNQSNLQRKLDVGTHSDNYVGQEKLSTCVDTFERKKARYVSSDLYWIGTVHQLTRIQMQDQLINVPLYLMDHLPDQMRVPTRKGKHHLKHLISSNH